RSLPSLRVATPCHSPPSLHDALPISVDPADAPYFAAKAQAYSAKLDVLDAEFVNLTANPATRFFVTFHEAFAYFAKQYNLTQIPDRKSTRLNSSHVKTSYAVFCSKKK